VVPALLGGTGVVVAAEDRDEGGGLAAEGRALRVDARVGVREIEPELRVLRDPVVVEGDGEQDRIRRHELVGQAGAQLERGLLRVGVLLGGGESGADGIRPRRGGDRVRGDVAAHDGVAGMRVEPFPLDEVAERSAGGGGRHDAGVQAEEGHSLLLSE